MLVLVGEGAVLLVYGSSVTRTVPQYLPAHSFRVHGTIVTTADLVLIVLPIVATASLYLYFR